MENRRKDGLEPNRELEQAALSIPPALEMKPEDYLPDMEAFDMKEAEKIELLQALWDIMRRFIEVGVDISEVDPCGQVFGDGDDFPVAAPEDVKSSFSKATKTQANHEGEEYPA